MWQTTTSPSREAAAKYANVPSTALASCRAGRVSVSSGFEIKGIQMLRWLKSSLGEGRPLGPLEAQLLQVLWQRGDATVRELVDDGAIEGAYTTVMTTLDRLHKKGLLNRVRDGRAFRYRPRQTEQEYKRKAFAEDLEKFLDSARDAAAPISFLVDTVTERDAELLNELGRVIDRKRRELKRSKR